MTVLFIVSVCHPPLVSFFLDFLLNPQDGHSMFEMSVHFHQTTQHYIAEDSSTHIAVYLAYSPSLYMEAVCSSEMSVNFYQTTWGYIPEDSTHKDLFCMLPARKSKVIPRRPVYGLEGQLQIQFHDQDMVSQAIRG
jgi:hypothetical protein